MIYIASKALAQTLEQHGRTDAAVEAYVAAGAVEDAARLLFSKKRFREAGELLVRSLGFEPGQASQLSPSGRRLAMQAAICFARAGDPAPAVEWFLALGERQRAAEVLRRAGDPLGAARVLQESKPPARPVSSAVSPVIPPPASAGMSPAPVAGETSVAAAQALERAGRHTLAIEAYLLVRQPADAARVALLAGRPAQAGEMFESAGLPFEAGQAFSRAGEWTKAIDAFMRVPVDSPRYREAAVLAIRFASQTNTLDFPLEHFLTRFVQELPAVDAEIEALYLLGRLYQRNDFPENARDAYTKVLRANGGAYRDARRRLGQIEAEARGSQATLERISREDEAFRAAALPGSPGDPAPALPELPELPALPRPPEVLPFGPGKPEPLPVTPPPSALDRPPPEAQLAPGAMTPAPGTNPFAAASPRAAPPLPQARPADGRLPSLPPTPPAPSAPPPPAATTFEPDSILAGRYRIVERIGQGGMASVYRARDLELDEDVALKVFTKLADDEQMIARFKQELTLSRRLNHPNILRLYDIGMVEGLRYITMELLRGGDLKSKLSRPLPLREGIGYLLQCCAALQHAHDHGVVHRDIKPANLFVTGEGIIKLMDFGIAKRQATPGLTVAGMIAGTPEYMSPEQIRGFDSVTGSTDLYALGIVAYEMFTGTVPFHHAEIMPLLVMQMQDPPPSPGARNPAIPPELEHIILKLLQKDPADRYGSCREVAQALGTVRC